MGNQFEKLDINILEKEKWGSFFEDQGYFSHFIESGLLRLTDKLKKYRKEKDPFSIKVREFVLTYQFRNYSDVEIISVVNINNFYKAEGFKAKKLFNDDDFQIIEF